MEFDKEVYPDEMKEKLEEAVMNSAENYVDSEIREREMNCENCGSEELEPEVSREEQGSYTEKAVCSECGSEQNIQVDISDLRSASIF